MPTEFSTSTVSSGISKDFSEEFELPTAGAADTNDVHAFDNALFSDPFAESIMSKIGNVSGELSGLKVDFEVSLKKAAETSSSTDILNSMRLLSEYTLQTSMIAKTAGKTSQAVEKLTSLS